MKAVSLKRAAPSDFEKERAAFEQAWQTLGPSLDEARTARQSAAENPAVLSEPRNRALVRWFDTFETQLVALQNLHNAVADGTVELPVEDVRFARENAERLVDALQQARNILSDSSPPVPAPAGDDSDDG
jgi:hypothetical protein